MIKFFTLFILAFSITACGFDTEMRTQTANHIARPAFMVERDIDAGDFTLQAWERMHQREHPATIYIEDDAFLTYFATEDLTQDALFNPTPVNPVALHLASRDQSKNLGYLARPCQFIKMPHSKGCEATYARNRRYSPEVFDAYNAALDNMAAMYDLTGFHLVGHGGGANIAAVLAAQRQDVLSLRTVAGDLNPDYIAHVRGYTPLDSDSMLAVDYARSLTHVPQYHFIGGADRLVTPGAYHSYRQMVGLSDCIHYSVIADADHTRGWVEKWPELLAIMPQCAKLHNDLPSLPPIDSAEIPNYELYKGLRAKP